MQGGGAVVKLYSKILIISGIVLLCVPIGARFFFNYYEGTILPDSYTVVQVGDGVEGTVTETTQPASESEDPSSTGQTDSGNPDTGPGETETTDSSTSATTDSETKPATKPQQAQTVLGRIVIDKINVDLTIVEGVARSNLAVGAGHVPGTAGLGMEGNCVIAAHRNSLYHTFFRHLDQLAVGDRVVLSNGTTEYTYIVSETTVVDPSEVSVLQSVSGKKELTLITCTPLYLATKRLIVSAYLEE